MTPTTTPAPMTHEGDAVFIPKPCCIMADGACFEKGECLSDCEALDRDLLRGASERELRQRLERAERDRNDWRTRADALAARISELEAGIGRLADEWEAKALTSRAVRDRALMLRATELRSLIGHKEG